MVREAREAGAEGIRLLIACARTLSLWRVRIHLKNSSRISFGTSESGSGTGSDILVEKQAV